MEEELLKKKNIFEKCDFEGLHNAGVSFVKNAQATPRKVDELFYGYCDNEITFYTNFIEAVDKVLLLLQERAKNIEQIKALFQRFSFTEEDKKSIADVLLSLIQKRYDVEKAIGDIKLEASKASRGYFEVKKVLDEVE